MEFSSVLNIKIDVTCYDLFCQTRMTISLSTFQKRASVGPRQININPKSIGFDETGGWAGSRVLCLAQVG